MLVSNPRFAAQLVTNDGEAHYFDDVGCLAAYLAERVNVTSQAWLRDERGRWLKAEGARFEGGAKTPMDYGFQIAEAGSLDWIAVRARVRQTLAERTEPR